ncbi:MAG: hypothetical protein ABI875_07240, partial [Gemmatimonadales bacterium]
DMQRMHMMMPGMEQGMKEFDLRGRSGMRMMEGDMGLRESRTLEPGTRFKMLSPSRVRVKSPQRLKVEKEQKAKADSVRKELKR